MKRLRPNTNIKPLSLLQCPVNRCRPVYNPIPFRYRRQVGDDFVCCMSCMASLASVPETGPRNHPKNIRPPWNRVRMIECTFAYTDSVRVSFTADRFRFAWCDANNVIISLLSAALSSTSHGYGWWCIYVVLYVFVLLSFSVRSCHVRACVSVCLRQICGACGLVGTRLPAHAAGTLSRRCAFSFGRRTTRNHLLHDKKHNASAATAAAAAGNLESKCFYSVWWRWRWYCTVGLLCGWRSRCAVLCFSLKCVARFAACAVC